MSNLLQPNFTSHGRDLRDSYERIRNGDENIAWALYSYEKHSNDLRVLETGQGGIAEFIDDFSDGKIMYAFSRVIDPNSGLSKFVLIGWCGEGVPEDRKGVFNTHFPAVQKFLNVRLAIQDSHNGGQGYHVSISARSQADVEPEVIMKKVEDASGAKYGVGALVGIFEGIQNAKQTSPLAIRSSRVPDPVLVDLLKPYSLIIKKPSKPSFIKRPPPLGFGTTPSLPKASGVFNKPSQPIKKEPPDSKEVIKGTYQRIGTPDIAALRASSSPENAKNINTGPVVSPSQTKKSPIASSFGTRASQSFGTTPPIPGTLKRESKALTGLHGHSAQGGKTPSQIWAEGKAKKQEASVDKGIPSPVSSSAPGNEEVTTDETLDISAIRERFSQNLIAQAPSSPKNLNTPSPARGFPLDPRQVLPLLVSKEITTSSQGNSAFERSEESLSVKPPSPPRSAPSFRSPEIPASEARAEPPLLPMDTKPGTVGGMQGSALTSETVTEQESWNLQPEAIIHQDQGDVGDSHTKNEFQAGPFPADDPTQNITATVIYSYTEVEDNEIVLVEGDLITSIDKIDEGWWMGTNPAGHHGLFPKDYVEELKPTAADSYTATPPASSREHCAEALYEYIATEDNEISFDEGDIITQIAFPDEDWWQGEIRGTVGLFPAYSSLSELR
ncbi:Drebrin-like protein [Neolecta irregularis DAH-3]|uniref:Drebrin-like protein n=1 Tax=Neolecta irregularis (strain DAH-3) TaxID=1198029 RepID=A0A1U7LPJ9_NEOID|nr:Drebrin-like protein [Neolecta irregularis DAH-3]|eukprot:OLL24577.1 Drebrin-like protein [Neolecta irregularis DAH-3]